MNEKKIVCFHGTDESNGYLSNWHKSRFCVGGTQYTSMEQYMMEQKATLFGDYETRAEILNEHDPAKIKKLGRKVKNYDERIWSGMRQPLVSFGLLEKFRQNAVLLHMLLDTGETILVECAVHDSIWGIGLSMQDPNRLDMTKWRGKNLLGYSLMAVRQYLKAEEESMDIERILRNTPLFP